MHSTYSPLSSFRCGAILLLTLSCLLTGKTSAQWNAISKTQWKYLNQQCRSNITVDFGIGTASLLIASNQKDANRMGIASHLQVGYTYFWQQSQGFHTGLGIHYAHAGFHAEDIQFSSVGYMNAYNGTSSITRRTHYSSTLSSVNESYDAYFLEIPLQLSFQDLHFWMNAGFKVLLPVSINAIYDYGAADIGVGSSIDGFGVAVEVPIEIDRLDPHQGEYTVGSLGGDGVAYPFYAALALSGGYRLALNRHNMLQFGIYFDIALNRASVGGVSNMVELGDGSPQCRYLLQSNIVSSLRYIDFGLSVTYNFTFGERIGYYKNDPFHPIKDSKYHRKYLR